MVGFDFVFGEEKNFHMGWLTIFFWGGIMVYWWLIVKDFNFLCGPLVVK
jgi:hypothetical protein